MGLHSSLLQRKGCVLLGEAGLFTSITTMSLGGMKMWVHTPLSLCDRAGFLCVLYAGKGRPMQGSTYLLSCFFPSPCLCPSSLPS